MRKTFRTYNLAVEFYRQCNALRPPRHLKDQLDRASSSVVLNLAEGYGRTSCKEQTRYFQIAMGSLRECQAVLDLLTFDDSGSARLADSLGAHLYKLIKAVGA